MFDSDPASRRVLQVGAFVAVALCAAPSPGAAHAMSEFDLRLYQQLAMQPGNLAFSPYSIVSALTLTYTGARGETAAQMASVLGLPIDTGRALTALRERMDAISNAAERAEIELRIANALWGEESLAFEPAFVSELASQARAPLERVNFKTQAEAVRLRINGWMADATENHIADLLVPGVITPDQSLVLVNAIYFRAPWTDPFRKEATRDVPFHLTSGGTVLSPTMHQTDQFPYFENEQLQVVQLPYAGGAFSLMVILPRERGDLARIESALSAEQIEAWSSHSTVQSVTIALPRFEARSNFQLADQLGRMGMPDAFSLSNADFSGITRAERTAIGEVVHAAWLRVDEAGSEAAAVTAVMMLRSSMPTDEYKKFSADHAFLYLIQHRATGTVLFMGRIEDPSPART